MDRTRSVLVEAHRLEGWLSRFEVRNGPYTVNPNPDPAQDTDPNQDTDPDQDTGTRPGAPVRITAANGCTAVLTPPLPAGADVSTSLRPQQQDGPDAAPGSVSRSGGHGAGLAATLLGRVDLALPVGLLLIRRGGYSVGVAREGRIVASKTGTRYVQGRTAAGGWSQQRFARRRANQAAGLVEETAGRAAALFAAHPPALLQLGGDRTLAGQVLAEPVLRTWTGLPRTPFLTVQDPRYAVLEDAGRSALSVRITVTDPVADG
ncbi:acVLRF1 family peptidyl-tRNA hydrolase [uncultured Arthrobacter sp.]|uniref:acVLRF1 family peptidyl-tRNA hydrolase n=1 Tax=uncultured Arthrobacter sp. TaxID=114050 RepID=UPI00260BB0CB|nr:acVLRF1 family peptidyl-tRNA hydrolase [uncultured Arthrobacter sp.]